MLELDPNELVVILRALYWEEEKWNNTDMDYRAKDEIKKISQVRQKLADHIGHISFMKEYS
jgi:hypothetical protein